MTRRDRRKRRKFIFSKFGARYHPGYFAGTRAPDVGSADSRAMDECEAQGVGR